MVSNRRVYVCCVNFNYFGNVKRNDGYHRIPLSLSLAGVIIHGWQLRDEDDGREEIN